jgi:hypothetical protein
MWYRKKKEWYGTYGTKTLASSEQVNFFVDFATMVMCAKSKGNIWLQLWDMCLIFKRRAYENSKIQALQNKEVPCQTMSLVYTSGIKNNN